MTFAEFHAALERFAAGRYCTSKCEISTFKDGTREIEFQVYIDGHGWGVSSTDPNVALASLCTPPSYTAESLGDLLEPEPHPTIDHTSEF